ncbi:AraC family transcriptional regulator [Radiobacillus sp. PE A8.2]|uniref:AraC family transcriptional regulator n=1 Tax=Radiobacillus sp. PE A8.2 TaxID=3380349 RepID=UPI00388F9F89
MKWTGTQNKVIEFWHSRQNKPEIKFHSHTWYEIFYFHGGKCTYLIGDQVYSLYPGDLIIMNGMTLHRSKIFKEEDYIRSVIHFDPTYFHKVLRPLGMEEMLQPFEKLQSFRITLDIKGRKEVEDLLKRMADFQQKADDVSHYQYNLTFLNLLVSVSSFCKKTMKDVREISSEKENHVRCIMAFIEKNYMEELSMQMLEEELHLSKYYLSKIFKAVTGVTVFNYLYQRRINQAKILFVLEPDKFVTEVCYTVGFKHLSHFSKIFKQLEGCSPEAYRQSKKENITITNK